MDAAIKTATLRPLTYDLDQLGREVAAAIRLGDLSTEDQVVLGQLLWTISKRAVKALDPIKGSLRQVAVEDSGGVPGPVYLHGPDSTRCTVTVPQATVRVRKGTDMDELRKVLGDDFDKVFQATMQYRPRDDFKQQVSTLTPAQQRALLKVVDFSEGTPRVAFRD